MNIYNIYADVCLGSNKELTFLRQMAKVSWFHGLFLCFLAVLCVTCFEKLPFMRV